MPLPLAQEAFILFFVPALLPMFTAGLLRGCTHVLALLLASTLFSGHGVPARGTANGYPNAGASIMAR